MSKNTGKKPKKTAIKSVYLKTAFFALPVFLAVFVFIFTAEPASAAISGATENSPDGNPI